MAIALLRPRDPVSIKVDGSWVRATVIDVALDGLLIGIETEKRGVSRCDIFRVAFPAAEIGPPF